jgi:hypothetical protein
VLSAAVGVVGLHIQPTRIYSLPRGHVERSARRRNDEPECEGGTMDTSRRPDGPLDSRVDRQVRQVQGLQVMTRILSRIQSRIPSDRHPSTALMACEHQDALPGALRQGRRTSMEGGGARPLGGLEHQAGAAAGHPEPPIGGSERCRTPSQVLPPPRNTVNTVGPAQPFRCSTTLTVTRGELGETCSKGGAVG